MLLCFVDFDHQELARWGQGVEGNHLIFILQPKATYPTNPYRNICQISSYILDVNHVVLHICKAGLRIELQTGSKPSIDVLRQRNGAVTFNSEILDDGAFIQRMGEPDRKGSPRLGWDAV